MTDEVWYPVCPICRRPVYDKHDAYEVQVTYLGWRERTNKWVMCANCFENSEAGMVFNKATNFVADRRVRPPPYQLRKVLRWYVQDIVRDLIGFIRKRKIQARHNQASDEKV